MAATEDPALFEMSPEDRVAKVRMRLENALDKAESRAEKAEAKAAALRSELDEFDAAIAAVREAG